VHPVRTAWARTDRDLTVQRTSLTQGLAALRPNTSWFRRNGIDLAGREASEDDALRHLIGSSNAVVVLQPRSRTEVTEGVLAMGAVDVVSMDVTADALLSSLEHAAGRT
jgi:hypothetical protein